MEACSYAQLTMIVNLGNRGGVLIRPVAAHARMRRAARLVTRLVVVVSSLSLIAACAAPARPDDGRLRVVAAFYPLEFVTERVGLDRITVTGLTPPGAEAHDLELVPSQVADLTEADLVLYLSGFQPAVDDAVAGSTHAVDARTLAPLAPPPAAPDGPDDHDHEHLDLEGDGHDHGPADPHLWLDPDWLARLAGGLAGELARLDPAGAAAYRTGADRLGADLAALDERYARGLADCSRREMVVSHAAFGYLAQRYGLRQIAISGLSPEVEPTPRRLSRAIRQARATGATTIFFARLASPDVAELIAREVGATTAVLDPLEGLPPGSEEDYFSVMEDNLQALRTGLGCR